MGGRREGGEGGREAMSKQVRALRTSSAVDACATIDTDKTGGLHLLTCLSRSASQYLT